MSCVSKTLQSLKHTRNRIPEEDMATLDASELGDGKRQYLNSSMQGESGGTTSQRTKPRGPNLLMIFGLAR